VKLVKNASHICTVLNEASGRQAVKYQVFLSGIKGSNGAPHVEIRYEENSHQFLRYQGNCTLWIHYTRSV